MSLSQIEDLMEEKSSDVKQQLKEPVLTPELYLLSVMPDNIDGIKCYLVSYLATTVRKCEVKNRITVLDSSFSFKKREENRATETK